VNEILTRRRSRSPLARRRVRIALVAVLLLGALFTTARIVGTRRTSGGGREHWRQHDEALVLYEAGRHAEAAARYRRILEGRPGDAVALFNLGLCLVESSDPAAQTEGWSRIEAAAARQPEFDAAHTKLADRALADGRHSAAIRHLTHVVASPPEPDGARSTLAELLIRGGRRGEALVHLRHVLDQEQAPPELRAHAALQLGRQHGRRAEFHRSSAGERSREETAYKQALKIIENGLADDRAEGRVELLAMRPFALVALARHEEALGAVDVALDAVQDPGRRAGLRTLRAQVFWLEGDATRARAELDAALEDDAAPDAATFVAVADLYESRGFRDRAIEVLKTGAATHPTERPLRLSLAHTLFLAGRADEADFVLGEGEDVDADDDLMVLRGRLRRAKGDLVGARRAYEIVVARSPTRTDVKLSLHGAAAELALTSENAAPDAIRDLERVARELLRDDPQSSEARLGVARALLLSRRSQDDGAAQVEARSLLIEALDLDPLLFEAHIALAVANLRVDRFSDAAYALERVIGALPDERPRLRVLLARAYLGMGASRDAYDEARRAVDGLGDDVVALTTLVRAAQMAGERTAAMDGLRRLELLEPDEIAHPMAQAFLHAEIGEMGAANERFEAARAIAEALADEGERRAALLGVAVGKADALKRAGDVDGARGAFNALVGRLPRDVASRVQYGRFLQATGDVAEAERVYQQAIRIDDLDLAPRRALVELWTNRGDLTKDLADQVRRMRVVAGDDPVVLYVEGRLATLQGDLLTARERLERAAAARPDDADFQFALGVVLSRAGDLDAAVASLERAVALVPESEPARDALSRARFARAGELARVGRVRAARALLEASIQDQPTATAPRLALADVLRMTGAADLSESQVRSMLDRDPDDTLARRMLATALARRGAMTEAAHQLLRVTEDEPDDWTGWAALSAAYLEIGDAQKAEAAATRCRDVAPLEPAALAPALQVLVTTNRTDEAAARVDAAIAAAADEPVYHLMRAMLHARAEEHRAAVAAASAALDLAPGMSSAAQLAVQALRFGLGDSDGALVFAKERAARAPEVVDLAYIVGWLEAQRGNAAGALAALRPLADAEPPHQGALASCAIVLMEQRETAKVRALLDRGLAVNPENANFHFMRAQAVLLDAMAVGDAEVEGAARGVAVQSLRRVIELVPWHHTARNNLAFVLSSEPSTLAEALEHSERAVREAPGHAPYADTLGTIQMKLGRVDDAIVTFEAAFDVIQDARDRLAADSDVPVARSEPDRMLRMRQRLDRQEADVRRHYEDAVNRRGD